MKFETEICKYKDLSILKLKKDWMPLYVDDEMMEFINNSNLAGKNVVDGGSNIGLMSLIFSEAVGDTGLVYAFELQRLIQQVGCANAILNGKLNIISFNASLSERSGDMTGFSIIDYTADAISSTGIRTEPTFGTIDYYDRVKSISLDDLNISNIGLIKLDLEGHEPEALKGMWNSIDRWKPNLIIEISPGYLGDKTQEIIESIKAHGYTLTDIGDFNYIAEYK